MTLSTISHIRTRRAALRRRFDVARQMQALEETCIPSYLHPNVAAEAVALGRLFAAARLYRKHAPSGPVLDFGAGSGELAHVLPDVGVQDGVARPAGAAAVLGVLLAGSWLASQKRLRSALDAASSDEWAPQAHPLFSHKLHACSLKRGAQRIQQVFPFSAGIGADYVPPSLVEHDLMGRRPAESPEPLA
jgi:hypothetical protein